MLVTSRALLHLSLEREYLVPPLATPETSTQFSPEDLMRNEAVRLFVERARGVKANFALTDENARCVADICVRLDGLPLAIELAAARVRILSPRAILARLDRRLKLLTGGAVDLPTRQQTISGAMEWSYELLSAGEKQLFRRLAVFAGGFTLEAAEGVVAGQPSAVAKQVSAEITIEALEGITSLVDKSLLVPKPQTQGEVRFRMLEVVREYALDRLEAVGEAEQMRRRHAAYFLGSPKKPSRICTARNRRSGCDAWRRNTATYARPCGGRWLTTRGWRHAWARRFDTFGSFRDTWRRA